MFRTIYFFSYFWLYLFTAIPAYLKVNHLFKSNKIEERDRLVNRKVSLWAKNLLKAAGTKVTIIGAENIPTNQAVLFVSNHQGNFDIPLLLGFVEKPKAFVSKIETLKLPMIRTWMKQMNCVFMDRDDIRQSLQVMNEAGEHLKEGYSMVVFPEGTRSKRKEMGEFKAGSLRIATKSKVPIVPITIKGSYKIMEQNGFMIKPAKVEIVISKAIETAEMTKESINGLSERVRSIIASNL